jgi:hypothetical protein
LTNDLRTLHESIFQLCSLFAFPHPSRDQFVSILFASPLLARLIAIFDDSHYRPIVTLLAQLFIDVSGLDPRFAGLFTGDPFYGHEKIMHVLGVLEGGSRSLLHVLAYNTFGGVADYLLNETDYFADYCRLLNGAHESSDAEMCFFAPFVHISLLRFSPLPVSPRNFLSLITTHLLRCEGGALEMGMWALYFWFKRSWSLGMSARSITKPLVEVLAVMLETGDATILKIALYIHCHLWVSGGRLDGRLVHFLASRYLALGDLLVEMMVCADGEIAGLAFLLLNNCLASDPRVFERMNHPEIVDAICSAMEDGPLRAKIEAAELLCTILLGTRPRNLVAILDERIARQLLDALDLESAKINESVFRVLLCSVSGVPELLGFLVEVDLDGRILEMDPGLSAGEAASAVIDMICRERALQQENQPLPNEGAWSAD